MKDGELVELHYTIKVVEDGKEYVYETTREDVAREHGIYDEKKSYKPIWIIVGKSRLIDPLEKIIREMDVGEKREVIVEPEEAFGPYRRDLIVPVSIKRLRRAGIRPREGEEVEVGGRRGRIIRVTERFAYIDFNHPLAGKKLKIEVEILRKAETEDEKVKAIVLRYLPLKEEEVKVEIEDGKAEIELPGKVIVVRDLESALQTILANLYESTTLKEVEFEIKVTLPREEEAKEKGEEEEGEEETGEGATEETASASQ